MDNYEILEIDLNDILTYVNEMIYYIDNKEYLDKSDWYYQDEVIAYFKSIPETIIEMKKIIKKIQYKK